MAASVATPTNVALSFYERFFGTELEERYGDVAYMTYVYSFGRPSLTGHGSAHRETMPRILQEFELECVTKVAAGSYFTLALTRAGQVYVWGQEEEDGSYQSWYAHELEGYPARPQVLRGDLEGVRVADVAVSTPGGIGILCGVVLATGEVWVWACDGHRDVENVMCSAVPGVENATAIVLGDEVGAVMTADGVVFELDVMDMFNAHGGAAADMIGRDVGVAVRPLPSGRPAIQLAAGSTYLCALDDGGNMYTWGSQNPHSNGGYLGHGSKYVDAELDSTPRLVEALAGRVRSISAGWIHTCAVDFDGQLWAWGDGHDSRLGLGSDGAFWGGTPKHAPAVVEALKGIDVIAVSNSRGNEACLTADNEVYTWGGPRFGGAFHADTPSPLSNFIPLYRNGIAQIQQISCGRFHCVLVTRVRLTLVELCLRHLAYNRSDFTQEQIEYLPEDLQDLLHRFLLDRRLPTFRDLTDIERAQTRTRTNETAFFDGRGSDSEDDDDDFYNLRPRGGGGGAGMISLQQLLALVAQQGLAVQDNGDGTMSIFEPAELDELGDEVGLGGEVSDDDDSDSEYDDPEDVGAASGSSSAS